MQEAYNYYGTMEHCNCKGDCSSLSQCACRVAGRKSTFLCHGGRANNKNCTIMDDFKDSETDYDGSQSSENDE